MKKVILFTVLGFLSLFLGIYTMYIYLDSLNNAGTPILLFVSLALFGVGAYSLVRASHYQLAKPPEEKTNAPMTNDAADILKKNNEMMSEYGKTADARDRLKMLETASESGVL